MSSPTLFSSNMNTRGVAATSPGSYFPPWPPGPPPSELHRLTTCHLNFLTPRAPIISSGANDSDTNYDFINRSTTDLVKSAQEHKSEEERIKAVIKAWQDSPEAAEMARSVGEEGRGPSPRGKGRGGRPTRDGGSSHARLTIWCHVAHGTGSSPPSFIICVDRNTPYSTLRPFLLYF